MRMGGTFWTVVTVAAISMTLGGGAIVAAHYHVTWAVALIVLLAITSAMLAGVAGEEMGRGR